MRLTVYRKMVLGFGVIILIMILVTAAIMLEFHGYTSSVRSILSTDVRTLERAQLLRASLEETERHARKYLATGDSLYLTLFTEAAELFTRGCDSLAAMVTERGSRELLARAAGTYVGLYGALAAHPRSPLPDAAVTDSVLAVQRSLDGFINRVRHSIGASVARLEERADQSLSIAIGLSVFAVFATAVVALLIARTITRPLTRLIEGTRRVARGEFRPVPRTTRDEIGQLARAFNAMGRSLQRSTEQRAEMLQHISHEIRIPLQTIHSAYYLLAEGIRGPVNERQRELLATIRRNVDRIADFSNQFLDLSRIEAGRMEFALAPTDPRAVVEAAIANAGPAAAAAGITVRTFLEECPRVSADPSRLEQALGNLLSNAVKYSDVGGTVTVRCAALDGSVDIAVQDTGIGIRPEDLPHVFTKFYRAAEGGRKRTGTGLGLALVKAIVDHHRGTVTVTSEPGAGSTFVIRLPAADPPAGEEKTA